MASTAARDQCSGTEKPQNKTAVSAVPSFPLSETGTKSIYLRIVINSCWYIVNRFYWIVLVPL